MTTVTSALRKYLATALVASASLLLSVSGQAQGQGKLSDDSVHKLMNYAWQQTPHQFTKPDNTVVHIDKKNPDAVRVPVDVARDIIIAARRSALAQICKLDEHQLANYRSMMLREIQKKKWSPQQEVFISMLHITTVQIFAGEITIKVKEDGDKVVEETLPANKRAQTCTEPEAAKLKEQIEAYVQSGPGPEVLPASATPPAKAAQPGTSAAAAPTPAAKSAPTSTGSTPASTTQKK